MKRMKKIEIGIMEEYIRIKDEWKVEYLDVGMRVLEEIKKSIKKIENEGF